MQNSTIQYAAVWSRAAAFAIDFAIILWVITSLDRFYVRQTALFFDNQGIDLRNNADMFALSLWSLNVLHFIAWIGYFILLEESRLRASLGKLIFKIRIVDDKNKIPDFIVILTRNIYKLFPIALYQCVGTALVVSLHYKNVSDDSFAHAMSEVTNSNGFRAVSILIILIAIASYGLALCTQRKQTLHDLMAHTLVVKTDNNPLKQLYLRAISFIQQLRKANFSDK